MTAKKPNPDDIRRKVELCAYHIWEREGRPQGREYEHWRMAEAEILGVKPKKAAVAKANGAKTGSPNGGSKKESAAKPAAMKAEAAKASAGAKSKKPAKASKSP